MVLTFRLPGQKVGVLYFLVLPGAFFAHISSWISISTHPVKQVCHGGTALQWLGHSLTHGGTCLEGITLHPPFASSLVASFGHEIRPGLVPSH